MHETTPVDSLRAARCSHRATSRTRIRAAALVVALAALAAAPPARAESGGAEAAALSARAAYNLGDYEVALERFEEAYRLSARPDLLRNIAYCHEGLGNWEQARFFYERYLGEVPAAPDAGEVRTRLLRASSRAAPSARADGARPSAPVAIAWRTEKRTDPRIIRAGAVGLVVTWAVTASGGLMWALGVGADRIFTESVIPIAGPFVVAIELHGMGELGISTTLFALAGIAQTAALVTLVAGLTIKRPVEVPAVGLGRGEDAPRLTLMPALVDGRAPGLSVVGWNF